MSKALNLKGKEFNYLLVQKRSGSNKQGRSTWECLCKCGTTIIATGSLLVSGNVQSCGCFKIEKMKINGKQRRTHGMKKTPEYTAWRNMKDRCYNKKDKNFKTYGGRGITVCEQWRNSFENFLKDMGKKPSKKHSLDRVDNNKGYSPDNCKWVTMQEQSNNRRSNKRISFQGITMTIAQWARFRGITYPALAQRIRNNWDIAKALEYK